MEFNLGKITKIHIANTNIRSNLTTYKIKRFSIKNKNNISRMNYQLRRREEEGWSRRIKFIKKDCKR
jgi:hypothetical protein